MLLSPFTVWSTYHVLQAAPSALQDKSEIVAFGIRRNWVQMISWEKKKKTKHNQKNQI